MQAESSGGDTTSDGGVLLLRQADRRLGLTAAVTRVLPRVQLWPHIYLPTTITTIDRRNTRPVLVVTVLPTS